MFVNGKTAVLQTMFKQQVKAQHAKSTTQSNTQKKKNSTSS
jgi:hypothetical protein